jgi:hypothetical protein
MLSCFYRKLGSLLGLFAILMATLAPTISQAVAESRNPAGILDILCSAQTAPAGGHVGKSDPSSLADHMQACGYCNLLAHMPALPTVTPSFASTVWAIQHPVATRFESVRRILAFTAAQPRAPPLSS